MPGDLGSFRKPRTFRTSGRFGLSAAPGTVSCSVAGSIWIARDAGVRVANRRAGMQVNGGALIG